MLASSPLSLPISLAKRSNFQLIQQFCDRYIPVAFFVQNAFFCDTCALFWGFYSLFIAFLWGRACAYVGISLRPPTLGMWQSQGWRRGCQALRENALPRTTRIVQRRVNVLSIFNRLTLFFCDTCIVFCGKPILKAQLTRRIFQREQDFQCVFCHCACANNRGRAQLVACGHFRL